MVFQLLQTDVPFIKEIANWIDHNPGNAIMFVALVILIIAVRGWVADLGESRKMLSEQLKSMQQDNEANNNQESKVLDIATNAINKMDTVSNALNNFADAQRTQAQAQLKASDRYFEAANRIATAHMESTDKLVTRLVAMEEKRSEDEIYANEKLLRSINEQLMNHQEIIGRTVGQILTEAHILHEATRNAVTDNNQVLMAALRSSPPPLEPSASSAEKDT